MLLERQIWLRCYLLFFEVEVEGFPACFSDFVNGILGDDLDALFDVNGGVLVVSAAVGLGTIGGGIGALPILISIFVDVAQWWHFELVFLLGTGSSSNGLVGGRMVLFTRGRF